MDKKLLVGIVANVLVILFVLGIFLSPATTNVESNVDSTNDNATTSDADIKLIKAETRGYVFVNNGSDPYYNYYLDGVLLNLPSDIEGYDLKTIPVGTIFECNGVVLEITQIGKECHSHCAIHKKMGTCIMPTNGIFAKVIKGGTIKVGDELEVVNRD